MSQIVKTVNFYSQDRNDIPKLNDLEKQMARTYQEILQEMTACMQSQTGKQLDFTPGSFTSILMSTIASQLAEMEHRMIKSFMIPPEQLQVRLYHYPDGTDSVARPKDGQTFIVQHDAYNSTEYIWDDVQEQWSPNSHCQVKNQSVDFIPINIVIHEGSEVKCECGSEKTGSNKHSTWCQKFNPDF